MDLKLDWDRSVIVSKVSIKNTKSIATSQIARAIGKQKKLFESGPEHEIGYSPVFGQNVWGCSKTPQLFRQGIS